jgi:thymidylate synthase
MSFLLNPIRSAIAAYLSPLVCAIRGVSSDSFEVQYLALVRKVLAEGSMQGNRTSKRAISMHGAYLRFDVSKGYPALTTKKLAFKSVVGELVAFLRGKTSAADFRALGSKVWDQNANENEDWLANPWRNGEDHMGEVYGAMWRRWPAFRLLNLGQEADDAPVSQRQRAKLSHALERGYQIVDDFHDDKGDLQLVLFKEIDQLRGCLDTMMTNPTDRRMLFTGWNPALLDSIALPACHHTYNWSVNVEKKELSLAVTMRSTDVGLGLPFNAASSAALMELFGRLTGLAPKWLSVSMADAHIYENQVEMLEEQLRRIPMKAPRLVLSDRIPAFALTGKYEPAWLDAVHPSDFSLDGYEHHAPLAAAMAV